MKSKFPIFGTVVVLALTMAAVLFGLPAYAGADLGPLALTPFLLNTVLSKADLDALDSVLTKKATEISDAVAEQVIGIKDRLLDLEQKNAHKPGGGFLSGDSMSLGAAFAKAIHAEASQYEKLRSGELKTMRIALPPGAINTKAIVGDTGDRPLVAADRSGQIISASQRRLTARGLLPSVPTGSNMCEFSRELAFTNNAGAQYEVSPELFEGAAKNESTITFELVQAPVRTIAHWFAVSRQALDDAAALQQHIETRGLYGLALEEEDQILNGDGTNGTLTGLVSSATAFNRGATADTKLDTIRKAITQLALSEHIATGIVLNPADWEEIELSKDTTGQYLSVVLNINGQPQAWRVPVVPTNSMASGAFLVGDFQLAARVRDRQQAFVQISLEHSDFFTKNLAAVLIEERIALEIHRGAGLITGSFHTAGQPG